MCELLCLVLNILNLLNNLWIRYCCQCSLSWKKREPREWKSSVQGTEKGLVKARAYALNVDA